MRMPAVVRRSPSRSGIRTRTRALSILMGSFCPSNATHGRVPPGYRRGMHRRIIALCTLLVLGVACSDDDGGSTDAPATLPGGGTVAPTLPGETALPTTTLMPDCAGMPTPADLSTLVG